MRKYAALFFAAVMLVALPGLAFDDVPPDNTFQADIEWLADTGITRGCNPPSNTRFCPDQSVTRGAMAAFLTRALGLPAGKASFADTGGHVFASDIAALADAGITRGCNPPANDRFCPDQPVTRGAMAAFLTRALGLPAGTSSFTDTGGHVFAGDVASLADAGITRGCNPPTNNRFCPDQAVTRAQMAAFLNRALGSGSGPAPQPPSGLTGTIYGHWDGDRAYRFDLDAANPIWEQFIGARSEFADVVAATNEWVGTSEGAWIEENVVRFIDLDTQLENDALIWPDSGKSGREIKFQMMAVSDDGQLIAAKVTEWINDPHLEVVRRSNGQVIGSGYDQNESVFPVSAMEWTPGGDLIVASRAIRQSDNKEMPVISVIPAAAVASSQPYEQSAQVYFAFDEPGAGTIQWVALSADASQLLFVEKGNVWVASFTPGSTPRQLTTGFWAGDAIGAGWTGQFSPDGSMIALANQVHRQYIIPNHTATPINLELKENEQRYLVGESLVSHIDAWLP